MDTLSKHLSSYRPKRNRFGSEQFTIAPIPREELPDEMRSVLESFISSQRPSLADLRLVPPDVRYANTGARSQDLGSPAEGRGGYDYDGRDDPGVHGPNSNWPFNFTLKGNRFPSRVYHTHQVVPRSRPNAKEQLGRRKWHPSRRHGRLIRREDYDVYAARELGQTTQFLNSESLLDLSLRGGRTVKGVIGNVAGSGGLRGWPCSLKSKLGKVTKVFGSG